MCVVNKQFEHLAFVFNSVNVDLKYNEISLTFTARYVWCVKSCGCHWSVCEVVLVPYAMGVVKVVPVQLFVLNVSMLRVTAMLLMRTGEVWFC